MWVCYCNRVSEGQIRDAVRDGACTVRQVARETGAATCCGGCRPVVEEVLSSALSELGAEEAAASSSLLAFAVAAPRAS